MFEEYAVAILVFSIFSIPFLSILGKILGKEFRQLSKWFWFGQVISTFLLLTSGEIVLVDWLVETTHVSYAQTGFDILWWLVPAYLIILGIETLIWTPTEKKYDRFIPNIIRIFAATIIYSLAVFGIIVFVYKSIIIASIFIVLPVIGIGFAIHQTSAGIALNIDRPFRIGDWVKIGEFEEGEVVDITWRTVRLKTRDECLICIPNQTVLQSTVKNFCYPDDVYWLTTTIKVSDVYASERVKKILLDAVLSANKILREPSPVIIVTNIGSGMIQYNIACCADDYGDKNFIKDGVFIRIWHCLRQADIEHAVESQNVLPKPINEEAQIQSIFENIDIFKCLVVEEKKHLAKKLRHHHLESDDNVFTQSESGDSLFFIVEGIIGINVTTDSGETREVARLGLMRA
jgi:branched-chain amino acid transport system substrate-binding protein